MSDLVVTVVHGQLIDRQDLLVIAGLYVAIVALNRAAFVGFTADHVAGLFLCFAAALLLIELPWASIAGFADVLALMLLTGWLAVRHQRKAVVAARSGPAGR